MKKIGFIFLFFAIVSCVEKLVEAPDDLISKEKMTDIYFDLAILSGAKNTDSKILAKHKIETMDYVYKKYDVDSLQFAKSDLFYASTPVVYKEIYEKVQIKIDTALSVVKADRLIEKKQDSIDRVKRLDSINKKKD
ncbi:DUF4296 domain-containing protein [Cellulophaga baltica]|uniref:DUF4296 domain-containing protein n=1 Tax=Cellulophaga TaxID=104264 RepID=UPI001C072DAB|nr:MULTISPECIES: DUF4296 domain-containing protein [Cellulophaga]MBU2995549.1 DUF4296 domain-containing protein [Cellulophaga baltica]MDO6766943.1 DUF4296 domain-containing protein [Cellulophaga sp. 1_MG-2023]